MARCTYCNSIHWGGVKAHGHKFCNHDCAGKWAPLQADIPPEIVEQFARQIHDGPCPRCEGTGPVDVHHSHFVFSVIFMTRWSSRQHIVCRKCATRAQLTAALGSALVGWWGFPWGLVFTPVQITKNLAGLRRLNSTGEPSPQLRLLVERILAARYAAMYPARCPKCGYDMRGNVSGACPECGTRFREPDEEIARQLATATNDVDVAS